MITVIDGHRTFELPIEKSDHNDFEYEINGQMETIIWSDDEQEWQIWAR